jgi:class 3 adenylate cyclase
LKAHRRDVVDPRIAEHRGRIVKTTGDGLLVEFASVVDAVRCAVEIQREMAKRNADVRSDRRIEFRGDILCPAKVDLLEICRGQTVPCRRVIRVEIDRALPSAC